MMSRLIFLIGATMLLIDKGLGKGSVNTSSPTNSTIRPNATALPNITRTANFTTTTTAPTIIASRGSPGVKPTGSGSGTTSSSGGSGTTSSSGSGSGGSGTTSSSGSGSGGSGTTSSSGSGSGGSGSGSGGSGTTSSSGSGSGGSGSGSGGSGSTSSSGSGSGGSGTTASSGGGSTTDGTWETWSKWMCTSCGKGNMFRTRTCTNGGKDCVGSKREEGKPCKPCAAVKIITSFKVKGKDWNDTMLDQSSPAYKQICGPLIKTYKDNEGAKNAECLLKRGSVVVLLNITYSIGDFNQTSTSSLNFTARVLAAIKTVKFDNQSNLSIDETTLKAAESVSGVNLGDWGFPDNVCDICCDNKESATVIKSRDCTEVTTSCTGVIVSATVKCDKTSCDLSKPCPVGGNDGLFSSMTLVLLAFLGTRVFV